MHPAAGMSTAIEARAAREAAHWMMRLQGGELDAAARQGLARWRAAHPDHETAWQRAEQVCRTFGMLPPPLAMPVLDRPAGAQRRAALKTLALLIVAGPTGWAMLRAAPWQAWTADLRTATGEIRHLTLADGSGLSLNTASAADIVFSDALRLILLRAGELHVATGPDPLGRPFIVRTGNGSIRALGTRFTVRQEDRLLGARTHVAVSQGAVEVRPAEGRPVIVQAGWQASFDETATSAPQPLAPHACAWLKGLLYADDTPLAQVLTQLSRYRHGVVRCDPTVARLRVSGVYQLRDTDALLALLQASLPIRVRRHSRWWISVEPA
ncbi:FecR domain-containing protein [Janthinobacterium sp. SUN073]|uniref:FecR domain-containing protein n=1 Tax=Janthinobacterium sp. SUN073 TaxID=3004102 RepID=UPI0025B2445D|nr:FecR domain-containing protein [Janthinobacterium sp. SUN073]MDN2697032.1 FecR domain-containing protein [Janthinobacterium sp. SUN073]